MRIAFLQKDSHRRFPRDEEFRAAFVVKDVYNFHSRNYMLRKLENHGTKEPQNIEKYTIEHIMPQNEHLSLAWRREELGPDWKQVHAQYLHTIGNLTLTGYNPELSDTHSWRNAIGKKAALLTALFVSTGVSLH